MTRRPKPKALTDPPEFTRLPPEMVSHWKPPRVMEPPKDYAPDPPEMAGFFMRLWRFLKGE
jgi:hypothetical protein